MCDWERCCAFAREPERRLVAGDARVTIEGVIYDVAAELAGETVVLWWGLFDQDLYVEHDDQRFGPYKPSGGPIPLHRYRKAATSRPDERTLLATRLRTALQIEQHLALAFEEAFRVDVKPVIVEVVESVLSRHMDDLEPRPVQHGYDTRSVAELIGTKPGEVRLLLQGRLEAVRAREMTEQMLAAGLPV